MNHTINTCPTCGQIVDDQCEVEGCDNLADYEGWWRKLDGFGVKTGLVQKRKVCEKHKYLLIGQKGED